MFENSEISQNIMNENNGRRGGGEVNTARKRCGESRDVVFQCDESSWKALSCKELGSDLLSDHSGCYEEERLQTPKRKTIVTWTWMVAVKLACVGYDMLEED